MVEFIIQRIPFNASGLERYVGLMLVNFRAPGLINIGDPGLKPPTVPNSLVTPVKCGNFEQWQGLS